MAGSVNQLGQYASSPGNYCYAELTVFSIAVVATIASTHFAHPLTALRDAQAELALVAWFNTKTVYGISSFNSNNIIVCWVCVQVGQ